MKKLLLLGAACGVFAVALAGCGGGGSNNNIPGGSGQTFAQTDRLARPVVNEVFATFANNRHLINDTDNPTDDQNQLANDIDSFMTGTAGRSRATTDVVKAVLVPDVMVADLSVNSTTAAYLGSETGGATGSKFGGRALQNDVVDTSLGIVFGNTISKLGLAADDNKEIPNLTTDNVDSSAHAYLPTFPYLGNPK